MAYEAVRWRKGGPGGPQTTWKPELAATPQRRGTLRALRGFLLWSAYSPARITPPPPTPTVDHVLGIGRNRGLIEISAIAHEGEISTGPPKPVTGLLTLSPSCRLRRSPFCATKPGGAPRSVPDMKIIPSYELARLLSARLLCSIN